MVTFIQASGETARLKAMVSTLGIMAIDTKESGRNVSNMATERTYLRTVTVTKVIMLLENQMVLANTGGVTGLFISENSVMALSSEKASGGRMKHLTAISI